MVSFKDIWHLQIVCYVFCILFRCQMGGLTQQVLGEFRKWQESIWRSIYFTFQWLTTYLSELSVCGKLNRSSAVSTNCCCHALPFHSWSHESLSKPFLSSKMLAGRAKNEAVFLLKSWQFGGSRFSLKGDLMLSFTFRYFLSQVL